MARLPTYEPNVGVDPNAGSRRPGDARAPLDNTGLAVASFGGALDNVSSAIQRQQQIERHREDENAVAEAHVTSARAAASAYQQLAEAQDAQGDNPEGFAPKFMQQFDEHAAIVVGSTTNQKAQQFLRANMATLGLHMYEKSISWQAQQAIEYKGQQVQDSTTQFAKVLANDDTVYEPIRDAVYKQIEASKLPLRIRDDLREKSDAALTKAAAVGFTLRDPYSAQRLANDALGIVPPSTVTVSPISRVEDTAEPAPVYGGTGKVTPEEQAARDRVRISMLQDELKTPGITDRERTAVNTEIAQTRARLPAQTPTQLAAAMSSTMVDVAPSQPPTDLPNAPKLSKDAPAWMARMSVSDIVAMKSHADAAIQHLQGQAQARIRVVMADAATAAEFGKTPTIPALEEFVGAYGKSVGEQHYRAALEIQQTGTIVGSLQTMTPEQMNATRAAAYAKLDAPGLQPGDMVTLSHTAKIVDNALATVSKQREADPIWAAGQQGIAQVAPITWTDGPAAMSELKSRQGVAIKMRDSYGTGDYNALTKGEAAALRQQWTGSTPSTQMQFLTQMRTSLTDDNVYRATVGAIRPDSPVTAAVGGLIVKTTSLEYGGGIFSDGLTITPQTAGETMLRGEAVLNPTKGQKGEDGKPGRPLTLPKEEDLRREWRNTVGNAFRGNEQGEAAAYQLYRTYYAGKLAELGDISGNVNTEAAKQAALVATGGVYDWNGGKGGNDLTTSDTGKVIKPWGMDDARFVDDITARYTEAAASAGYKIPPLYSLGLIPAQSPNRDAYQLTAAGKVLHDARGRPIELDITPRPRTSMADKIPQ